MVLGGRQGGSLRVQGMPLGTASNEHPMPFEAEVPVERGGVMLMDHELVALGCRYLSSGGLGRGCEVTHRSVLVEFPGQGASAFTIASESGDCGGVTACAVLRQCKHASNQVGALRKHGTGTFRRRLQTGGFTHDVQRLRPLRRQYVPGRGRTVQGPVCLQCGHRLPDSANTLQEMRRASRA
jgi:hypothetical protein